MAALVVIFLVVISSLMGVSGQGTNFTMVCYPTYYVAEWTMTVDSGRVVFVTLGDSDCVKNVTSNSSLSFQVTYNECNTEIIETNELIIVKNTAIFRVSEILAVVAVRAHNYTKYFMSCELPRDKNISVIGSFSVSNETQPYDTYITIDRFELNMSMALYTSSDYSTIGRH